MAKALEWPAVASVMGAGELLIRGGLLRIAGFTPLLGYFKEWGFIDENQKFEKMSDYFYLHSMDEPGVVKPFSWRGFLSHEIARRTAQNRNGRTRPHDRPYGCLTSSERRKRNGRDAESV